MTEIIMDRFGSIRKKTVHAEKVKLKDGFHLICYHNCPHKMTDMEGAVLVESNLKERGFLVKDINKIEEDIKSIREHNNNKGICKCIILNDSMHVKYCFCG